MQDVGTPTNLAQRALLLFCHETAKPVSAMVHYEPASELDTLKRLFPDLLQSIQGRRVVDFGCGHGYQCVALAREGAAHVQGVEIQPDLAHQAAERVAEAGLQNYVSIASVLGNSAADIIISQNSFEHFTEPVETLNDLKRALVPGGVIYLTFGPLWYSPRGAHMGFFCRLPWVNLFFSEHTVMAVRGRFRSDGKTTYKDAGLGEMSLRRFEDTVRQTGLQFRWKRYDSVAGIPIVKHIPVLRELFVNRVSCILTVA